MYLVPLIRITLLLAYSPFAPTTGGEQTGQVPYWVMQEGNAPLELVWQDVMPPLIPDLVTAYSLTDFYDASGKHLGAVSFLDSQEGYTADTLEYNFLAEDSSGRISGYLTAVQDQLVYFSPNKLASAYVQFESYAYGDHTSLYTAE